MDCRRSPSVCAHTCLLSSGANASRQLRPSPSEAWAVRGNHVGEVPCQRQEWRSTGASDSIPPADAHGSGLHTAVVGLHTPESSAALPRVFGNVDADGDARIAGSGAWGGDGSEQRAPMEEPQQTTAMPAASGVGANQLNPVGSASAEDRNPSMSTFATLLGSWYGLARPLATCKILCASCWKPSMTSDLNGGARHSICVLTSARRPDNK